MASVLIVDDDVVVREVLYELFSEEHVCHAVESAEQALEFLKTGSYDVAIVDISLPGMSGLELSGIIRQDWPQTSVIVITGIDYRQYAGHLSKMGVSDYLVKPFQLQDAQGKLAKAVLRRERWPEAVKESAERAIERGRRGAAAEGSSWASERRAAKRHRAQRAARLLFTAAPSGVKSAAAAAQPLPTLIGHTRDISETGLALVVLCMREGDRNFYGTTQGLRVTVSLPTGNVEMEAAPVRYEWAEGSDLGESYVIGMRITGMGADDRRRFNEYLGNLP